MLTALFLLTLLGLLVYLRRGAKKKPKLAHEGMLPASLDRWVSEALAVELRAVSGLSRDEGRTKLAATLGGEPDPDVVSAVAEAVRKVDLEYTRFPHEADAELAVVVRYEDGREGRSTRRVPMAELPQDVHHELTAKAVTRVFRTWEFSWDR